MSNMTTEDRQILDRFAEIVATSLRIEKSTITENAYLDELGAESLDLLEITMEAEEAFNIQIPQKNILQTAQELVGEGVVIQDGKLTAAARRLLRARMPEFASYDAEQLTLVDLNKMFMRVGSWVQMIGRLMEHTPTTCPHCGAGFAKAVAGRLKCRSCAKEQDIPSGEDLNRQWVQQYFQQESVAMPPSAS
jgi:acyl carrier protein